MKGEYTTSGCFHGEMLGFERTSTTRPCRSEQVKSQAPSMYNYYFIRLSYPSIFSSSKPRASDVNDEILVKGLTALTISPHGSRSKLVTNAQEPEPEPCLGRKHVLLADTIRMARIACSKSMSG